MIKFRQEYTVKAGRGSNPGIQVAYRGLLYKHDGLNLRMGARGSDPEFVLRTELGRAPIQWAEPRSMVQKMQEAGLLGRHYFKRPLQ